MARAKRVKAGRPAGTDRFDAETALAFGKAIRSERVKRGIAQESLAAAAGVERSHMGKIERGTHAPQLGLIFRLATALDSTPSQLLLLAETILHEGTHEEGAEA